MKEKESKIDGINASSKTSVLARKLGVISLVSTIIGIGFVLGSKFYSPNAIIMSFVLLGLVLLGMVSLCGILAAVVGIIGFIRCKQWNYFDRFNAKIAIISGLLAFILLLITIFFLDLARGSGMRISCSNHASFLRYELANNIEGNDINNIYKLPYDPNLPGYGVFAKYTNREGATNCNHGAPHNRFGGWQALNLPNATLKKLCDTWDEEIKKLSEYERPEEGVPYIWCGKPTGSKYRTALIIDYNNNDGRITWNLWKRDTSEKAINLLNRCLKLIGEKQVPINIPDNIDWSKYSNNNLTN